MNLVDEQNVVRLEVRQQRRQIAGPFEHRTRGLPYVNPHLAPDDVRESGLAQPRRTKQQNMVKRLATTPGRFDKDAKLGANLLLTNIVLE